MSAPSDRAAARCACTNISLMQLFHELKQKFPGAPDHAVSGAISAYCHDKRACETHLESQAEASLTHAYHASSSAAARRLKDLRANLAPIECRNRPIEKRQFPSTANVHALICEKPQNARLSTSFAVDDNSNDIERVEATNKVCIEEKENEPAEAKSTIIQERLDLPSQPTNDESPITINIDSCVEKSGETPSDAETDDTSTRPSTDHDARDSTTDTVESTGSSGYRIHKSTKIKSNLPERLEKTKEKKVIKKITEETKETKLLQVEEVGSERPTRPCTLEFIKAQPDPNLKRQTIANSEPEPCRIISPIPPPLEPTPQQQATPQQKERPTVIPHWPEQGYPLNLSVNVNCHMDIANRPRPLYPDLWFEEYESPRAITSVNLTVCTPTSAMQSPVRETGGSAGGFEGHVTVTVSPSTTRPPRRHAPPPPPTAAAQQHLLPTPTVESAVSDGSLIVRQRARKKLLVEELSRERERLARIAREAAILAAPLPPAAEAHRLRGDVEWLRHQCQKMTSLLDMKNAGQSAIEQNHDELYHDLYSRARASPVPSRPAPAPPAPAHDDAPSWQCHVCTFRNHGLLNKCEECDMPRILLGTQPRSADSGVGSLTPDEARKLSTQVENMLLGNAADVPHANPACV